LELNKISKVAVGARRGKKFKGTKERIAHYKTGDYPPFLI